MNVVSRAVIRRIWFTCRFLITIIILISIVRCKHTNTSISKHQLQYVADQLKEHECLLLIRSLKKKEAVIPNIKKLPPTPGEDKSESCHKKLMHWNKSKTGKKRPELLNKRLKQLGHSQLANDMSQIVGNDPSSTMNSTNLVNNNKDPPKKKKGGISPIIYIAVIGAILALPLIAAGCYYTPKEFYFIYFIIIVLIFVLICVYVKLIKKK